MSQMYWTVSEAADVLAEVYLVDLGGHSFTAPDPVDPVTFEALARALDAQPEMLEQVWQAWDAQLVNAGWAQTHRDQARYWLDAVVIGGLTFP